MAWYDEAVFYHIYPLGLLGAPKQNEYKEPVNRMKELTPWISHIKKAGFNAIYIGPLFESVGHGYETTDYKKLDSRLGTNEDLKKFVADCHKEGVKVIFDGVFNHVGRDFFAFKDLKQNRENSPYRDWFCNVNFGGNNEYNDGFCYDNWGGYNLLVKLNQRNGAVKDYICDVIRFWVSEFDVDGIRLDAADVLDFDFMKALRSLANTVKPDFWLMGEVIHGDYTRWVNGETLHSVTNYNLHKALYSGHNEHNYFEIAHTVKRLYEMGGNRPDGLKLYNFADNHDVERIATRVNNKAHLFPIYVLTYTLPGVPSVYYGSEFGIEGKKEKGSDDSLRPALDYQEYKDALQNNQLTRIIAALGKIRQNTPALSYGVYRELMLTNRQYVFARSLDGIDVVVTVNNDDNEATVHAGGLGDGVYKGAISGREVTVSGGNFSVSIGAGEGEIWIPASAASFADTKVEAGEIKTEAAKGSLEEKKAEEAQKAEEAKKALEAKKAEEVKKAAEATEEKEAKQSAEQKAPQAKDTVAEPKANVSDSAAEKYGLDENYAQISTESIRNRSDYDSMSVYELQVAILEKMAQNGPVTDQMKQTVIVNEHLGSLQNWVKSFR